MINETINFIKKGKSGKNLGFEYSLNKLNRFVKIWTGRYYLIFALSGVGKSKFVYHQHIFNVIDQQINHNVVNNLHIDLYSLEISPITVTGIMIIYYLKKYKNIITDTNQLFSFENKIPEEIYKIIEGKEIKEYLKEVNKYLTVYTYLSLNTLIENTEKYLKTIGEIKKEGNRINKFINYYDKFLYEIIIDHISLTALIPKKNRYETIGIISKYLFAMRNKTGITPVIIQQVKPDRTRKLEETVSPSHEDLRDSPETFNDCDIALAIGNPFKHKIANYNGYRIYPTINYEGLKDRFRLIEIRKNRYGSGTNNVIPSLFIGETSEYLNIKSPNEITKEDYLKINNLTKTYN